MTISHAWQTSIAWIAQHWLLERLFFSCLELAVLAVGAALFIRLMKPRTPRLVALVWALVLIKPIVSLMAGSPLNLLEIEVPVAQQTVVARPIELLKVDGPAVLPANLAPIEPRSFASRTDALPQAPLSRESNAAIKPSFDVSAAIPTIPWLLGLWLVGVAVMFFKSVRARWQLARMVAACRAPELGTTDFYKGIAATMAVRRLPRLLLTDAIESPALVGLWKPCILIPVWLADESHRPALGWSLRHELTHWKHGDAWLIRTRELGEILFFFHPAAWFAGRRLTEAMEIGCDRAVIASEADAADYAQRLYEILEMVRGARRQPVAGGLFATRTQIARRFAALVQSPLRLRPRLSAPAAVSVSILAAVVLVVGAGLRRDSQADDEPANKLTSNLKNYRVLHFPADRTIGTVYRIAKQKGSLSKLDWAKESEKIGEARGDVRVGAVDEVRLDVKQSAAGDLSPLAALGAGDLQFLGLYQTDVNDEGLKHIAPWTGLRVLWLSSTGITDKCARHLAGLKGLQIIRLDMAATREEGLGAGDEVMGVLAGLPMLELISAINCPKVTDAGLAKLAALKRLKHLILGGTSITDAGLAHLKSFARLETLRLGRSPFTDAGLKPLAGLTNLKTLDLDGTAITDAGLVYLKDLRRLENLHLSEKNTDAGLAHLAPLSSLSFLRFHYMEVSDSGVKHLAKLKALRDLSGSITITDQGLAELSAALPKLQSLSLGEGVTDAGLRPVGRMKGLKTLWLQGCPITDEGLASLTGLENLEKLLLESTHVSGKGFKHLGKLRKLTSLTITLDRQEGVPAGWTPDLEEIGKLSGLTNLNLSGDAVSSDDLRHLAGLLKLETFESWSPIDDSGAAHVAKLTSLKWLSLYETVVTEAGLKHLANLRKLERLVISGLFTEQGLKQLTKLASLDSLHVSSPYVTDAGLKALAEAIPSLRSTSTSKFRGEETPTISEKDGIRRWGTPEARTAQDALEDQAPPPLSVTGWMNAGGRELNLEQLRGKVVLVDFWGTWCGPCLDALPKLNALHEKYGDKGLVIVGIHTTSGAEEMAKYVTDNKLPWPVAADVDERTVKAWHVADYPSVYLIDRFGTLRMAGIYDADAERAVVMLLGEREPPKSKAVSHSESKKAVPRALAEENAKPELLQGSWTVVQMGRGGKQPPQELLGTLQVVIKDSTLRMSDSKGGEGGSFTLDDSKKPKQIDLVFKEGPKEDVERSAKGIYELDGDTLKLAWRKDGGPRPTEFSSLIGERTSKLLILKRKPVMLQRESKPPAQTRPTLKGEFGGHLNGQKHGSEVTLQIDPNACAEPEPVKQGTYRVAWTQELKAAERIRVWDFVAWSESDAKLIAVEKSVDSASWKNGKLILWEFAADGKVIRRTAISERPKDELMNSPPNNVIGAFYLVGDEVLLVGQIDSHNYSFVKLDRERHRVFSKPVLEKRQESLDLRRAILTSDKKVLMVGSRYPEPIAISADLDGKVEWQQTYSQTHANPLFDAAISHDAKHVLLAGDTSEVKSKNEIERRVRLLWRDRRGQVQREQFFPGSAPRVAGPLADGKLAVVYDQRRGRFPDNTVAAIDANLNTVWSKDVEISGTMFPSICQTGPDRFVVAGGGFREELRVREYDGRGNQLRSFDTKIVKTYFLTTVGDSKQIFAAVTSVDKRSVGHWFGVLYGLAAVD